jgi:hypothetical protein
MGNVPLLSQATNWPGDPLMPLRQFGLKARLCLLVNVGRPKKYLAGYESRNRRVDEKLPPEADDR